MPANIAVRHRICTDIAIKIKELGYLGDCGYNQLLYPVEHQTRDLLKWIVDKLPRHADEGTEEILGANAILNRNITQSLLKWQKTLWTLPSCQAGKPLTNIYKRIPFSLQDGNNREVNLAASLLNRHALEKAIDHRKAEALNRRFMKVGGSSSTAGGKDGATGAGNDESDESQILMSKVLGSLKEADDNVKAAQKRSAAGAAGNKDTSTAGTDGEGEVESGDNSSKSQTGAQMALSFQELIKTITENQVNDKEGSEDYRGSRFAHATVFAQEADDGGINAAVRALGTLQVDSSNPNGPSALSGSIAAANAALAAGGEPAPVLDRKAQLELEEKQRQDEIRSIRNEIENLATSLENEMKQEDDYIKLLEDYENSLEELNNEIENLEKECLLRKKVLEMMPSASDNIQKLQSIVEKSNEKLKSLEKEWSNVEDPLLAEIQKRENIKTEVRHFILPLFLI